MKKNIGICGILLALAGAVTAAVLYARTTHRAWLIVLAIAVGLLVACGALAYFAARAEAPSEENPYRKKQTYLTPAEREFSAVLRGVVGSRYEVHVQVPLVSVIDKKGSAFRNELFRVIDYMIADSATSEPLLLIELNDASHNRADRRERDRKVAEICAAAGMPLVAFTLAEARNVAEVRKTIHKMLR